MFYSYSTAVPNFYRQLCCNRVISRNVYLEREIFVLFDFSVSFFFCWHCHLAKFCRNSVNASSSVQMALLLSPHLSSSSVDSLTCPDCSSSNSVVSLVFSSVLANLRHNLSCFPFLACFLQALICLLFY